MGWKRFLYMTAIIYSMNGSLDSVINNEYNSARAEINPARKYFIDYLINKDNPGYKPYINIVWNIDYTRFKDKFKDGTR